MSGTRLSLPLVEGVRHGDVDAAGIRFHVAEMGPADGPPVLLLHGWPQHWYAWRRVAPLLAAQGRRVVMPDLRGFGWSECPNGRYDKQTFADDAVALLDALAIERTDLIAHDWGAWSGFLACLGHPERFSHYLALNMYAPWPNRPSPRAVLGLARLWYQALIGTPGLGRLVVRRTGFVKKLISTGVVQPDVWSAEDLECYAAVLRDPARAHASERLYRTFLLRELGPYIAGVHRKHRLTVPTLLLHGTKDVAIDSKRLGDWERHADDMRVELRDDSGHFILEELPGVVAERALALFGR